MRKKIYLFLTSLMSVCLIVMSCLNIHADEQPIYLALGDISTYCY